MQVISKAFLVSIVIANTSSVTLHNVMLYSDNKAIRVGELQCKESVCVDVNESDSVRLVFTLSKKKKDWLCTCYMPLRDTIHIHDSSEIFDAEILRY